MVKCISAILQFFGLYIGKERVRVGIILKQHPVSCVEVFFPKWNFGLLNLFPHNIIHSFLKNKFKVEEQFQFQTIYFFKKDIIRSAKNRKMESHILPHKCGIEYQSNILPMSRKCLQFLSYTTFSQAKFTCLTYGSISTLWTTHP